MRKFFYFFTCEYCFSHYVAAFFLVLTQFQMLYQGWRGYLISEFALVRIANIYMSFFNWLRLDISTKTSPSRWSRPKSRAAPKPGAR